VGSPGLFNFRGIFQSRNGEKFGCARKNCPSLDVVGALEASRGEVHEFLLKEGLDDLGGCLLPVTPTC